MSMLNAHKLVEGSDAAATLADLCRPFAGAGFSPECVVAQPDEIPHPEDNLLVHHEHKTVVLEKHYGRPVEVHVQEERLEGDLYTRKIYLTPRGSEQVVEWGIVRLDFSYMAREVREEILEKKLPLGAVLIKHDVLRRIKPRWFLRLPERSEVVGLFGADAVNSRPMYGRIGTIYCNDEPAIELMELVPVNVQRPAVDD